MPTVEGDFASKIFPVQGVCHQGKELERVLSKKYRVTLLCFSKLPDPAWEDAINSLYIIMPGFSAGVAPPNYILYQTEQAQPDTPRQDLSCNCVQMAVLSAHQEGSTGISHLS